MTQLPAQTQDTSLPRWLWREWVKPLAVIFLVCFSFKSSVADWYDVPTGSMKPTILEGDRIIANKLAYDLKIPFTRYAVLDWSDPEPGDVVVCYSPADGSRLVKRVIAIPGDTLAMAGNRLIMNGQPLVYDVDADLTSDALVTATERLADHPHIVQLTAAPGALHSFTPITVPEGHYFVMGDNRNESRDSRSFGLMPRRDIVGRVKRTAFSLDRDAWYLPRGSRFFRPLD